MLAAALPAAPYAANIAPDIASTRRSSVPVPFWALSPDHSIEA